MIRDPALSKRLVLISVFLLLGIAAYRGKLAQGTAKRLWGVGVVAVILGLLADVAPQIAGPLALLTVVGSLSSGGDAAIQNFLGKLGGGGTTTLTNVPGTPVQTAPTHPGQNP